MAVPPRRKPFWPLARQAIDEHAAVVARRLIAHTQSPANIVILRIGCGSGLAQNMVGLTRVQRPSGSSSSAGGPKIMCSHTAAKAL